MPNRAPDAQLPLSDPLILSIGAWVSWITWIMHGLLMNYAWIMHGIFMDYAWIMHGLRMHYGWSIARPGKPKAPLFTNRAPDAQPTLSDPLILSIWPWFSFCHAWVMLELSMDYACSML